MLCRFTLLSEAALTPRKGQFGRWRRLCGAGRTVAWTESVQRKACGACTDLVPRAWVPQWPQNGAFLPLNNGTLNEIHPPPKCMAARPCSNNRRAKKHGQHDMTRDLAGFRKLGKDAGRLQKQGETCMGTLPIKKGALNSAPRFLSNPLLGSLRLQTRVTNTLSQGTMGARFSHAAHGKKLAMKMLSVKGFPIQEPYRSLPPLLFLLRTPRSLPGLGGLPLFTFV